eukprot:243978-Pyramimonas_sp.AAC.1
MIVDTAAGQALIGRPSLRRREDRLAQLGLKVLRVPSKSQQAKGVGGKTQVATGLPTPTGIGGK